MQLNAGLYTARIHVQLTTTELYGQRLIVSTTAQYAYAMKNYVIVSTTAQYAYAMKNYVTVSITAQNAYAMKHYVWMESVMQCVNGDSLDGSLQLITTFVHH